MKSKILIVDDEILIRDSLGADLVHAGYEVETAESGEEAIQKLNHEEYDLIITDLLMENIGGIELLGKVKEKDFEIPVIIITGHAELETAIEALRLGAADYLLKPYNQEELLLRIRNCLEKRELHRKIKIYENILPVCMYCKSIRDDAGTEPGKGKWLRMEQYIHAKSRTDISHGCCPACYKKHMES